MNTNRLFAILLLSFLSMVGFAQEKLYKEAVAQGQQANGAYLLQNKKLKTYTIGECIDFLVSKGYYIGNYEFEEVNRYGEHMYLTKSMEFIPPADFDKYVFLSLCDQNIQFNQLKKGSMLIKKYEGYYWHYYLFNNVLWSGAINNGMLEGKGVGLIIKGRSYELISGSYTHGFPNSEITVKKIDLNNSDGHIEKDRILGSSYDAVDEGKLLSDYWSSRTAANEKKYLAQYFFNDYPNKVKLLETACQKVKSLNISNDENFKTFDIGREFIMLYEELFKYDPQSVLPKAKDMFRKPGLETLDKAYSLIHRYVEEKMNGGSSLFDMTSKKPVSSENENDRLLVRASVFAKDLKKYFADDKSVQAKVQRYYDYIDILNGFYSIENSFDIRSCVGEDFWEQVINPNPKTTYRLNGKGREIKTTFETAGKTILRRIDENHPGEYGFLMQTYENIYNYYSSFIKAVNGQLSMQNNQHVSEKLGSSSFKEYKFENGDLVITLQNGDVYRFRQSEGKWKYSSGNTAKVFPSVAGYNSVADAITEAEKMNKDFWERGR